MGKKNVQINGQFKALQYAKMYALTFKQQINALLYAQTYTGTY